MLIDKDTEAFNEVMKALKMPKDTDEQKEKRRQALQKGYKSAAEVPLETARICEKILEVAAIAAEKGNKNSLSDAAVSALMAHAGVEAAALNVKINLSSIKDTEFVQKISLELRELQQRTAKKTTTILVIVEKSL
jgi:formiminotetrahydrofolate cyclodeaminase